MENHTVLVLADPADRTLALLEELPDETSLVVGNCPEAFERAAPEATVILNWANTSELLEPVFAMTPRLRWVHARSAGLDAVLFPALVESPVTLTNGRGVFSEPLGEFVVGAALYFAKDFRRMVKSQEAGCWDQFDVTEVAGQTMGIVGYGDIGRACARRARAMGMRVIGLRRSPSADPDADEIAGPEALPDLLARSDYVVLALPLTPATGGLIGAPELNLMQPTAVLMNVGRGPVVRERDLIEALRQRRIRGAALDVFETEPLPAGHPYYGLDNLLLSPHCADHTPDWLERAMRFFLGNFERFRRGEALQNVVDKRRGY
ncbi:MAG: D-2-hydroxyacid dehydrogenase [Bryobacteraceae bacterium]